MKRSACLLMGLGALLCVGLAGCKTFDAVSEGLTSVGVATGNLSPEQAASINKTAAATGKALEKFTPEQEYYLGRAVAATILTQYKPLDDPKANAYINLLGQTLAVASDKPETYGGYHFLILDTDEVNALSAPGGFILVSRGLLHCCKNEDALAAVLAHEIGHVEHGDGINAIEKSRMTSALTILGTEAAKNLGGKQLSELVGNFEDSIHDITGTLINSGYARKQEYAADRASVEILKRVGYDPRGLREMLEQMERLLKPGDKHGFGKTHPPPEDRIAEVQPLLVGAVDNTAGAAERQRRFSQAMAGI